LRLDIGEHTFDVRIEVDDLGNGPRIVGGLEIAELGVAERATLHQAIAAAQQIGGRGVVIFDDPDKLTSALEHLRHARHQLVLIQVLDRGEIELNYNRPVTFEDMEDGSRLQIDPKLIREQYRREVQAFLDLIKKNCGQSRIDYVPAFTHVPWDVQIREILSRTSRR